MEKMESAVAAYAAAGEGGVGKMYTELAEVYGADPRRHVTRGLEDGAEAAGSAAVGGDTVPPEGVLLRQQLLAAPASAAPLDPAAVLAQLRRMGVGGGAEVRERMQRELQGAAKRVSAAEQAEASVATVRARRERAEAKGAGRALQDARRAAALGLGGGDGAEDGGWVAAAAAELAEERAEALDAVEQARVEAAEAAEAAAIAVNAKVTQPALSDYVVGYGGAVLTGVGIARCCRHWSSTAGRVTSLQTSMRRGW